MVMQAHSLCVGVNGSHGCPDCHKHGGNPWKKTPTVRLEAGAPAEPHSLTPPPHHHVRVQSGRHGIHIVCAVLASSHTHSVYNAGAVKTHICNSEFCTETSLAWQCSSRGPSAAPPPALRGHLGQRERHAPLNWSAI